ncbi:MAG: hypothetical protein ABI548_11015 [Polyangiaceae bacterium]
MSTPIVYCETNWIVALAFPHHQLHRAAKDLRDRARRGECDLRVPLASLLEARGTLSDVANQLSGAFANLRNSLATASSNGVSAFAEIARALQSDVVDQYAQRNVLSIIEDIERDAAVQVLGDVTSNFEVLRELRSKLDFKGKDVVDLHLLAAILKDRRDNPAGPALLLSHNKKEFDPTKKRVPTELYEDAKLLWRDNFDLLTGLGQWKAKFEAA